MFSRKSIVHYILYPVTECKLYAVLVSWVRCQIFLCCQVSGIYTGRTLRAASHRVALHRIASRRVASHRIASRDPSGGPSNAHAPFLDSRLSGFSLRMVGDWPGVTPPYNGFTRPRRVLERKRGS